jgi:hypothetical protein
MSDAIAALVPLIERSAVFSHPLTLQETPFSTRPITAESNVREYKKPYSSYVNTELLTIIGVAVQRAHVRQVPSPDGDPHVRACAPWRERGPALLSWHMHLHSYGQSRVVHNLYSELFFDTGEMSEDDDFEDEFEDDDDESADDDGDE